MPSLRWRKALGIFWESLAEDPDTLPGDVGEFQVRHTHRENGCLIVHPADKDDAPFILVTGLLPNYVVHGSILGADAKNLEWWREGDGRPAYFVPQSALTPIASLVPVL